MSSKKCARCEKTVYPLEEVKCLDKTWHKLCFKCQECGMVLNMRNYKGFGRLPYCTAHCPVAKHTTVADTPEIRRIQENTKLQSTVKYHEEFEKQKGKLTQVADDPETLRLKANSKIISNVAYHGDLEKKAMMEQKRPPGEDNNEYENGEGENNYPLPPPQQAPPPYNKAPSPQLTARVAELDINRTNNTVEKARTPLPSKIIEQRTTLPSKIVEQRTPLPSKIVEQRTPLPSKIIEQRTPQVPQPQSKIIEQEQQFAKNSPYSSRQASTVIYTSEHGPVANPQPGRKIGSIADYDPVNDHYGSIAGAGVGFRKDFRMGPGGIPQQPPPYQPPPQATQMMQQPPPQMMQQQPPQMVQQPPQMIQQPPPQVQQQPQQQQQQQPPPQQQQQQQQKQPKRPTTYRAMYDYSAADSDEVSFLDGDVIINCTAIDEGWMTGTVQRTGQMGMLPANYVEAAN